MSSPVLNLERVRIELRHSGQALLQECSFQLLPGQRLTLVGESGAGKSLLAQAIMGTLPHTLCVRGAITVNGLNTHGLRSATQPLWGRHLMMLPQEPWTALSPLMRLPSQVAEAARYGAGKAWAPARARARQLLHMLGLDMHMPPWLHQISGGMAQRVGVACASAAEARLLIADEPTKGLDPGASAQVAELLMRAQDNGQALLTITHDLELASQLGGQLMVLQQGQVVEQGEAHQVLKHPQHPYTRALLAAQPKHWHRAELPEPRGGAPVIQAQGVSKSQGGRVLFEGLNLSLAPGEIVAISGPSGCGKTTLGNLLLGLTQANAGQVTRLAQLPHWKFQKLYQDPPAAFSPHRHLGAALEDVRQRHELPPFDQAHWLQALGLKPDVLLRLPHEVSGGELQRLSLMRLMILQPAFIFADEPSSRLDPITQQNTVSVLCECAAQQGCSVLLVSHDAHLAQRSSHRHLALLDLRGAPSNGDGPQPQAQTSPG